MNTNSTQSVCNTPLRGLSPREVAQLNTDCDCLPLPRSAIDRQVAERWGNEPIGNLVRAKTNLFAGTAVFVSERDWQAMQAQIKAIETIIALPDYQRAIAARTPNYRPPTTPGLFMGYDFHLSAAGPRLIEINTNAGGALIAHAALATAHTLASPCGPALPDQPEPVLDRIVSMLIDEWRQGQPPLAAGAVRPQTIAIVDQNPPEQYLYPDMLMMQQLLEEAGIHCVIVDPAALTIQNKTLLANDEPVDLIYNRLTDFYFEDPAHMVLQQAHTQQLAVISPAPEHHASYADKRNLGLLANAPLAQWGASDGLIQALEGLPQTTDVTDENAAQLWGDRKQLFFKPAAGYGSRAVYRGSKITRKVWQQVLNGAYLAQPLVEPAQRALPSELRTSNSQDSALKFDLRLYTHRGQAMLTTARLYRGQTTNFRTAGGGFAPVVRIP